MTELESQKGLSNDFIIGVKQVLVDSYVDGETFQRINDAAKYSDLEEKIKKVHKLRCKILQQLKKHKIEGRNETIGDGYHETTTFDKYNYILVFNFADKE